MSPGTSPGPTYVGVSRPKPDRPVPQVALGQARDGAPNVLVVMTDDMRCEDLRFMPWTQGYFDRFGLQFQNSFSPYPWCCPARASFVSGTLVQNHEVFATDLDYGFGRFDDSRSIATALREAGYDTAFVGRYLNGYGLQPSLVTGGNSARYVPAGWDDWRAMPVVDVPKDDPRSGGPFRYYDTTLNENGRLVPHPGDYQTVLLGEESREVLRRYAGKDRPWFLYLAPAAPHFGAPRCEADDPCDVVNARGERFRYATVARPPRVRGIWDDTTPHAPGIPADASDPEPDMSDQPAWLQRTALTQSQQKGLLEVARQRGEALTVLDRQLQATVQQLRETGELDDTILMFTSDNGYLIGEHRQPPSKNKPQEPALRVPFLVAGPGIPRGELRYDPVTTVDVTATIADYAGAAENFHYPVDGRSLRTTIEQGDQGWDSLVLYSGVSRDYPMTTAPGLRRVFDDGRDGIGLRTPQWSYSLFRDGSATLYDLDADPDELANLARDPSYAGVEGRLRTLAIDNRECWGAECQVPLPAELRRGPARLARETRLQLSGMRSYGPGGVFAETSTALRDR